MESNKIVVTGTDTDAGKTILSLLIMQYFFRNGKKPLYLKPFQTGCVNSADSTSDAGFIYQNIKELEGENFAPSVINCFENPKAPFFAARDMGVTVDLDCTLKKVKEKSKSATHVIMEGAGGLNVPLTEDVTMVDFIEMSGFKTIIAARAGLGTINHTLMTIELLRSRGIEPAGVVFMDGEKNPVPDDMVKENMEAVELFSGISVSGLIDFIDDFKNPGERCYKVIDTLFKKK